MKKLLLSFSLALFALSVATAQNVEKAAEMAEDKAAEMTPGPKMSFETMVMDYGEIEKGSEPLRKFTFVNDGTEPLVIKTAKGSCGCTVPDWPKEPILPGEQSSIDVRYDTNRIGQFSKTVTLTTNMGDDKIVLTIKGKVNNVAVEESVPEKEKSIF